MAQTSSAHLDEAIQLWRKQQPEHAAEILHAMKGSVGMATDHVFVEFVRHIEQTLKQRQTDLLEHYFDLLQRKLDLTLHDMLSWLDAWAVKHGG